MNVVICPSSHSFSFVCSKAYLISSNRRVLNSMLRATRLLHIRILLEDIVSSRLDWKKVKRVFVAQLCPTLCDPIDCSLLGSCVHGVLQARVLEWVAMPFSRGSSRLRDRPQVSNTAGRFFTTEPPEKEIVRVLSKSPEENVLCPSFFLLPTLLCTCWFVGSLGKGFGYRTDFFFLLRVNEYFEWRILNILRKREINCSSFFPKI